MGVDQATAEWKGRKQDRKKSPFLLKSIYKSLQIWHLNKNNNNKKKTGEAENVLSPSLHGGVCVCEGSLKLYFTAKMIFSEHCGGGGVDHRTFSPHSDVQHC